jgi:hypothetical protein
MDTGYDFGDERQDVEWVVMTPVQRSEPVLLADDAPADAQRYKFYIDGTHNMGENTFTSDWYSAVNLKAAVRLAHQDGIRGISNKKLRKNNHTERDLFGRQLNPVPTGAPPGRIDR